MSCKFIRVYGYFDTTLNWLRVSVAIEKRGLRDIHKTNEVIAMYILNNFDPHDDFFRTRDTGFDLNESCIT